ncbi:hypothetical protein IQ25_04123 [Novosphingobium taihuense]|nr:hypothetical protein IQ25_04123 [Novosphingobium taihuense]
MRAGKIAKLRGLKNAWIALARRFDAIIYAILREGTSFQAASLDKARILW